MWVGMTTMIVVERSVRAVPGNAFQNLPRTTATLRFAPSGAAHRMVAGPQGASG